MNIKLHTSLAEIQKEFNSIFPHLRLEFYRSAHNPGEASADREKLDPQQSFSEVSRIGNPGVLDLDGEQQIAAFESALADDLGLYAQVFRRSGNLWLQTTATDTWTLAEANRKGGHSEELYDEQRRAD